MTDDKERAELLAALHVAGAASPDEEHELEALLEADPALRAVVTDFEDSIMALASSFEPLETSPGTLREIRKKIRKDEGGLFDKIRRRFTKTEKKSDLG